MTTLKEIILRNDCKLFNTTEERLAKQYQKNDLAALSVGCEIKTPALFEQQRRNKFRILVFSFLGQTIIIAALLSTFFFTGFLFGLVCILSR